MAESKSHKSLANELARQYGVDYNKGKGVDINTPYLAIEVETEKTITNAGRQLKGHRKEVYIAPTTKSGVKNPVTHVKLLLCIEYIWTKRSYSEGKS